MQRNVNGAGQRALRELGRFAHIEQQRAFGECIGVGQPGGAIERVGGNHAGDGDGVLGRAERRGVAQLQLRQLAHGHARAHGGGENIGTLVRAFRANDLPTVDLAIVTIQQLDVQRGGTGIIARMRAGVDIHLLIRLAHRLQPRFGMAATGGGQFAHFDDGRAKGALVAARATEQVIRHDASLPVGRAGERHGGWGAENGVHDFHHIAQGKNIGIGRAHGGIGNDVPLGAHF